MEKQAQDIAHKSAQMTSKYEADLMNMLHKMNQLEQLVVAQRQENLSLEQQLSAAQDRIGGAERKASLLETENAKIQGELHFWNDVYQQDTGISHPMSARPFVNQSAVSVPLSIPMNPISCENSLSA